MKNQRLTNPYEKLDKRSGETYCIRSEVSRDDWMLIQSIYPVHGFAAFAVARFIYKLADEIRRQQWTITNLEEFLEYVKRITDTTERINTTDLSGSSTSGSNR